MAKKLTLSLLIVLVLALGALSIKEKFWPPEQVLARSSTLTVLSGEQVSISREVGVWETVTETLAVSEGNRIKTGDDSWALVTFQDGSTLEMEPGTEITIKKLRRDEIGIWQQVGRTWSGIKKLTGPTDRFYIESPSGSAMVRGTLLDVLVDAEGNTMVGAMEGKVEVVAQGITATVEAGMQRHVPKGKPPSDPEPIPFPDNRIEVSITGPAWGMVVDAQERSTGIFPPGVPTNQIPMSKSTGAYPSNQFVMLPVPERSGTASYSIILSGQNSGGPCEVFVQGYSQNRLVFTLTGTVTIQPYEANGNGGPKFMAALTLTMNDSGLLAGGTLGEFAVVKTTGPGKLDIKEKALAWSNVPARPQAQFKAIVEGNAIRFLNMSSGNFTGQSWDFGDGNTSTEMNPSHVYDDSGEYTIVLTLTSKTGEHSCSRLLHVVILN